MKILFTKKWPTFKNRIEMDRNVYQESRAQESNGLSVSKFFNIRESKIVTRIL